MNILAIDTTSAIASVAVMKEDKSITSMRNDIQMNHLQNLMPMIDEIIKKCELTINDITQIAISEGPGSFTGIRIGAATAKMLAQVLKLDVIPVPTLLAYAYAAKHWDGAICPMLDARRSQVYGAAYRWENGCCVEIAAGGAYALDSMLALIEDEKRILYLGDGVKAYQEQIKAYYKDRNVQVDGLYGETPEEKNIAEADIRISGEAETLKLAQYVCEIAYEKLQRGETVDIFKFKPVYMRKAEAEQRLEESRAKGKNAEGGNIIKQRQGREGGR